MAILGILDEHEVHGYELKKRMVDLAGSQGGVSFGSLYPALNRLERAGFVRALDRAKPKLSTSFTGPMTGAITGELAALRQKRLAATVKNPSDSTNESSATRRTDKRNRKVYGITTKGRGRLHELLVGTDPSDDRSFRLQVVFARQVSPPERIALFERRRAHLAAALANRTVGGSPEADNEADLYLRSLREHDTQTLNRDLGWVDELIAITREELTRPRRERVAVPSPGDS